ncbi:hypothetical protein LTR78_002812 [Recurvomyces mirabilis]|uniref:Uncharacterized protein n=1 Tax=Recurvomyces mirabilis TaxID=574656 RepID=A0AAE1C3X7_9PEZI|nr:hypothetical protein LTR78_002812 [Recurvomyces mirabilis]KAK5159455.1 hypothetical protein LTS14_002597 [Recurvomyces mirabilis]
MGWLSSDKSAVSAPEASQDGGYIAPDRSARQMCWDGRDSFFQCLERNGIVDSVKEDEKAKKMCSPELKEFEKHCASSWVTYFKKRRVMEYQRDMTIKKLSQEGATGMDMTGNGSMAAPASR